VEVGVLQQLLVVPVETVGPSPRVDGLPVGTLVHDAKVGPWPVKVREPVEGLEDHVGVAHDILAQAVEAVICIVLFSYDVRLDISLIFLPMCWPRFFSDIL
jgi:hypothetical protein